MSDDDFFANMDMGAIDAMVASASSQKSAGSSQPSAKAASQPKTPAAKTAPRAQTAEERYMEEQYASMMADEEPNPSPPKAPEPTPTKAATVDDDLFANMDFSAVDALVAGAGRSKRPAAASAARARRLQGCRFHRL